MLLLVNVIKWALVCFGAVLSLAHAQSTKGCGTFYGCFTFPSNCQSTDCVFIFKWSLNANSTITFLVAGLLGAQMPVESSYVAIGLSNDKEMGDDDVVICKSPSATRPPDGLVQHYYNSGKFTPALMDPASPQIGLANPQVKVSRGYLTCTFERAKELAGGDNVLKNYRNLFKSNAFILAAMGQLDPTGEPTHHTLAVTSEGLANFTVVSSVNSLPPKHNRVVKAHGALMTIIWIFLISVSMAIARYYKFLLPDSKIFGVRVWFGIHRPVMIISYIIMLIAVLIIFADLDWTWISPTQRASFTHAIFGMITFGLVTLQVLIGIFRPHQESDSRFLFNYFHRYNAAVIYFLALITMFIGIALSRVNLEERGLGAMFGWLMWVILFILIAEILEYKYAKTNQETGISLSRLTQSKSIRSTSSLPGSTVAMIDDQKLLERFKTFLLYGHLIVALSFAILLPVLIAYS